MDAAGAVDGPHTARRALASIDAWWRGPRKCPDGGTTARTPSEAFPYDGVLAHYRAVGRGHADPSVVARLREIHGFLGRAPEDDLVGIGPLVDWLPSTIDQETGDYDSYIVGGLLERLTATDGAWSHRGPDHAETDRSIDTLLASLAIDLARIEAAAPGPGRDRRQIQRTRACLVLLSRLADLAPRWAPGSVAAAWTTERSDGRLLADDAARLSGDLWARLPESYRLATNLSMVPATPLHDEQMFIRSIQLFETLYRGVGRNLRRADEAMRRLDAGRACAELADATARLVLSPVLFRVVTTMPRKAFSIIRDHTRGRSAIQSRAYWRIHLMCSRQAPSPMMDRLPRITVPATTLEDSYVALAARLGSRVAAGVEARMRDLDAAWRAMKRTHWGVTLKTIGSVPGTGGTPGADYLRRTAEVPLFPRFAPSGGMDER